jgi:hypothetical protein
MDRAVPEGANVMLKRVMVLVPFLFLAAGAAALGVPRVEYSADSITETADGVVEGRVHVAPGKERRETVIDGDKAVLITWEDKKALWMLFPEEKAYLETKPGESPDKGDLSGFQVEQTVVGPEKVDGIDTVKSKIVAKGPQGKYGGFWWTTPDGIVVKVEMLSVEKGSKDRIKMQLKNLKIGRQDPSLFEVPRGWKKMAVPGIGGMDLKDAAGMFR